jgi:WXG100 family type VII secretion target
VLVYSPNEINSTARKIHQEESELKKMENRQAIEVSAGNSWWKGQAGKAFIEDYNRYTRKEMNYLYNAIHELESNMQRLAREVQNAEDRRRYEAQQKALQLQQQQQQKNKK